MANNGQATDLQERVPDGALDVPRASQEAVEAISSEEIPDTARTEYVPEEDESNSEFPWGAWGSITDRVNSLGELRRYVGKDSTRVYGERVGIGKAIAESGLQKKDEDIADNWQALKHIEEQIMDAFGVYARLQQQEQEGKKPVAQLHERKQEVNEKIRALSHELLHTGELIKRALRSVKQEQTDATASSVDTEDVQEPVPVPAEEHAVAVEEQGVPESVPREPENIEEQLAEHWKYFEAYDRELSIDIERRKQEFGIEANVEALDDHGIYMSKLRDIREALELAGQGIRPLDIEALNEKYRELEERGNALVRAFTEHLEFLTKQPVVSGEAPAADIPAIAEATTLNGEVSPYAQQYLEQETRSEQYRTYIEQLERLDVVVDTAIDERDRNILPVKVREYYAAYLAQHSSFMEHLQKAADGQVQLSEEDMNTQWRMLEERMNEFLDAYTQFKEEPLILTDVVSETFPSGVAGEHLSGRLDAVNADVERKGYGAFFKGERWRALNLRKKVAIGLMLVIAGFTLAKDSSMKDRLSAAFVSAATEHYSSSIDDTRKESAGTHAPEKVSPEPDATRAPLPDPHEVAQDVRERPELAVTAVGSQAENGQMVATDETQSDSENQEAPAKQVEQTAPAEAPEHVERTVGEGGNTWNTVIDVAATRYPHLAEADREEMAEIVFGRYLPHHPEVQKAMLLGDDPAVIPPGTVVNFDPILPYLDQLATVVKAGNGLVETDAEGTIRPELLEGVVSSSEAGASSAVSEAPPSSEDDAFDEEERIADESADVPAEAPPVELNAADRAHAMEILSSNLAEFIHERGRLFKKRRGTDTKLWKQNAQRPVLEVMKEEDDVRLKELVEYASNVAEQTGIQPEQGQRFGEYLIDAIARWAKESATMNR